MWHVNLPEKSISFFALVLTTLMVGCTAKLEDNFINSSGNRNGGSSGGGNAFNGNNYNGIPTTAYQDRNYDYTVTSMGAGYTYALQNAPSWLSINATTGRVSGAPTAPGVASGIMLKATKGSDVKTVGPFDITVVGDALTRQAWHLGNSGQSTFSKNPGVAGEDMRVKEAVQSGYTGSGVKIGVSDTGLEIRHDDLKDNASLTLSKNYAGAAPYLGGDPSPTAPDGDHGTSVSGIISARGWNGMGARGIAPESIVSGFNFIPYQAKAGVFLDQVSGAYDIFNQSWGSGFGPADPVTYTPLDANYRAQVKNTVLQGRNGRGSLVVRAAGNDYLFRRNGNTNIIRQRSANLEEDNALPWMVVVGAMNARGVKASYSSAGACLWISGLAGEFGDNDPAMLTTDVSGCDRGYSRSNLTTPASVFELGQMGNSDCKYTSIFNGTSSASPSIAGVIALILHANPNLTWRDVKHILARTATKVHANYVGTRYALDPIGYISEPGWLTNAAGFNFHNWYGFGRADAKAAVDLAKTYTSQLGTFRETVNADLSWKYSKNVNLAINDNNAAAPTAVDTIAVAENWIIEAVQIQVSATHPFTGDLGVELVAPSGTKSIVLAPNGGLNTANLVNVTMLSNAFYGENSAGNWTIRVIDGAANLTGSLTNWKINISGHTP